MARAAASLRALLAHSIDYAGLFPPASLNLEASLKNYASYLRSNDSWMLSTFVLPTAKFADAAWFFSEFSAEYPLRVSALGPKTTNEIDFAEEIKSVTKGIRKLSVEGRDLVRVEQIEMPLPIRFGAGIFAQTGETVGEAVSFPYKSDSSRLSSPSQKLLVFCEAPADNAEKTIEILAKQNANAEAVSRGFKLRTGGVTADAFPSSAQIARVLVASARHKVPIKFTAGLHHPVRMFRDEVKTKMHGFLNVLGAGVLGIEHDWDEEQTAAMLDDEDASVFRFSDEAFGWRDFQIASDKIREHRRFITSFGSCSFDEPRDDLRELELL